MRIQRRGGGHRTKREAEQALRTLLGSIDSGEFVDTSDRTVEQWLVQEWLPTQRPPRVSPNRFRNIRNAITIRLVPGIGHVVLQDLSAANLDRLYLRLLRGAEPASPDDWANDPGGLATKPYAPATVLQTHDVTRKALRDALKWGLVTHNVATLAEPPSQASVKADSRQAINIWLPDQLARFLTVSQEHWLHPMWVLTTTTGLRRAELAGLIDDKVNLDQQRLVVDWQLVPEEQLEPVKGIEPASTAPVHKPVLKASASARTVDLDRHTIAALRQWRSLRHEWQLAVGSQWLNLAPQEACRRGHPSRPQHSPFVFCWPDGRHLNPDWISHEFTRLCKTAKVPVIRLQDVRHTHASLLLAGGEHLKVVQERLGWASVAFMLETYSHLIPGMQQEAAERFAADIFDRQDSPDSKAD